MHPIEWRPKASAHLLAIAVYIAADNPTAAQALKNSIEKKVEALAEHPKLYRPGRIKGTRELVAHQTARTAAMLLDGRIGIAST